jgi:large subunit ribosomal protein L32
MANPTKRHSKSRKRKRRTHDSLSAVNMVSCPQCGETRLPHHVCPHCGVYKGRQVITVEEV